MIIRKEHEPERHRVAQITLAIIREGGLHLWLAKQQTKPQQVVPNWLEISMKNNDAFFFSASIVLLDRKPAMMTRGVVVDMPEKMQLTDTQLYIKE